MQRYASRSLLSQQVVKVNCGAAAMCGAAANSGMIMMPSCSTSGSSSSPIMTGLNFQPQIQYRFNAAVAAKKSRNPYKVLGVKQSATVKDLKKAHRVMARKYHPDVPGGSHEKFQEIQDAYEQVKSGVWIRRGGSEADRQEGEAERPANRYAGFRFTTGGNRRKQTYEETYSNLHKNKDSVEDDDIDMEQEKNNKRRGAAMFGPDSPLFQAWTRLIFVWSCAFVVLRTSLFMTFPPKYEKVPKKKMSTRKAPPPPKPLASTAAVMA